ALVFAALFVLRRLNRPPGQAALAAEFARWRVRHWALIHLGCVLWGLTALYFGSLMRDAWLPLTVSVIISVTLGSALSQAFAMERAQTTLTLALLYAPSVALFVEVASLRPLAVIVVVYLAYLLSSMRRLGREYDTQLATEYALLQSRAEIERLTRIDALTGLANRREYAEAFPKAWHLALRQRTPLALLMFDLDHFKALNDGHGHLAGDACLEHFARLMTQHFRRDVDLLARVGGEEFVAVLPGSTIESAAQLAERFRESLERAPCTFEGRALPMTVSVGVGGIEVPADATPEATFARVDRACYWAKTLGRNRVVLAAPAAATSA
ncbi:MAG: GGDEF domain-containing protein, partial [Deltaproteobacteria bacterium]|nr:GGDEF domain-containing protein [Deltaproteobacteria bacterium]